MDKLPKYRKKKDRRYIDRTGKNYIEFQRYRVHGIPDEKEMVKLRTDQRNLLSYRQDLEGFPFSG
jgi:hypothetical protein